MALILTFPSGVAMPTPTAPAAVEQPAAKQRTKRGGPKKRKASTNVVPIKPYGRIPKQCREEDDRTAIIARLATSWQSRSYELAQSEPNSERHRFAQHMAGISERLPRNNLKIFTTPDDIVEGVRKAWRRVTEACLEWQLADHRRYSACLSGDEAQEAYWSAKNNDAEAQAWLEYERLIRIPARNLHDVELYKLDRTFRRIGSLQWMRTYKPELAAVIDDEIARLNAEKAARKAERAARKTARSLVEA